MDLIRAIEQEYMKPDPPADVRVGDTVELRLRIREGEKERTQLFTGTVIALKGGGIQRTMTVRRIVAGEGVELTVPLHSPRLDAVRVLRRGKVRRAKLYYLRQRTGKGARIKEDVAARGKARKKAERERAAAKEEAEASPPAAAVREAPAKT